MGKCVNCDQFNNSRKGKMSAIKQVKNASVEAIGEILHERIYYRKNLRLDKNRKIQVRARRPGNLRTIKGLAMSHMANPDVVRNFRFYIHIY